MQQAKLPEPMIFLTGGKAEGTLCCRAYGIEALFANQETLGVSAAKRRQCLGMNALTCGSAKPGGSRFTITVRSISQIGDFCAPRQ